MQLKIKRSNWCMQKFAERIRRLRFHANRAVKSDRWGHAMREHEQILAALMERDGAKLADVLMEHLMNKCTAVLEGMSGPSKRED